MPRFRVSGRGVRYEHFEIELEADSPETAEDMVQGMLDVGGIVEHGGVFIGEESGELDIDEVEGVDHA